MEELGPVRSLIDVPSGGQAFCPLCHKPFRYWPDRQEVYRREDGLYVHRECPV